MSLFVDTSGLFAAVDRRDRHHERAREVIGSGERLVTTDHVLVESWTLARNRSNRTSANRLWAAVRGGFAHVEIVGAPDLELAWRIGETFPDQDFSIFDRTSFAVMERLGITRVVTFDAHFSIYRYGPRGERAFEVVR